MMRGFSYRDFRPLSPAVRAAPLAVILVIFIHHVLAVVIVHEKKDADFELVSTKLSVLTAPITRLLGRAESHQDRQLIRM